MEKPIKISIDTITKQTVINYNNIVKGDTLQMTISMYQNSASLNLAGQSIYIILKKSDGYGIEKNLTVTSGNMFTVDFDVQATLAPGEVQGEIQLADANGTSISNKFIYEVDGTLADDIVIKSKDDIETLQDIQDIIDGYNGNVDALEEQNTLAIQNKSDLSTLNSTSSTLIDTLETDISSGDNMADRLESDISTGSLLDSNLKSDIANSDVLHNTLQTDISNANAAIAGLAGVNIDTIMSYINLMQTMLNGTRLTDENGNYLTDENGNYLTM